MGMHRPEYVVKGSDPFDYEQKFPEDKRYEELGPMARVWRTYLEECGPFDLEMAEGWRDALDVLLVFAGLFSAVVTTFVADVNYGQVTATLLIELIDVQRSAANGSLVNTIPRSDLTFRPSASDTWVNGLWFTSLSLSLSTALFAVLTKQWIHQYMSVSSGTPQDRCRLRQFRYMGLQRWGVDLIIGLLSVLMSASLASVSSRVSPLHHPPSCVDRVRCWKCYLCSICHVHDHELSPNPVPFVPLQDVTVAVPLSSLCLYPPQHLL
ncbi:hypothetical protein F5146DRAFT_983608 [Armillaria mellea]|nr:hypothetical protein F5146DRAFT_983608 [Armillaria mellea]